jgi:hypothetical protein
MQAKFSGDFSLKTVKLFPVVLDGTTSNSKYLDIKELVQEISIYESVISASLYCQIVVTDIGENLISSLPLMGQERIEFEISTASADYVLNFYLYKIDGRVMQEKNQAYVMHLVSLEALHNESTRIMERVDGIKSHDFLKEKLTTQTPSGIFTKKKFDFDESLHPFNMYVPNWRLFDTAIWMARRSVPVGFKNSVGYLFYETIDGFKFKSIDTLYRQESYPSNNIKYTFTQANTGAKGTTQNNFRILNYSSPKAFDIFNDLRNGAFCHRSVYVDINNRIFRVFNTNAAKYWNDMQHLDNTKPFRMDSEDKVLQFPTRIIYRPTTMSTFGWKEIDDTDDKNIDQVNKSYEKSIYRYYFLEYNKLEITVPGDLKIRAGNTIKISIPSPKRKKDGTVEEDKRISGKYLVHSVRHTILNRTELRTTITLARDSFGGNNIPDVVPPTGQSNLGN